MSRVISVGEYMLVKSILKLSNIDCHTLILTENSHVEELNDGGMGSFEFIDNNSSDRVFGNAILDGVTYDTDGRKVMIELSIDDNGNLYQLDCFTEDFEPLKDLLGTVRKLDDVNSPPIIDL